MQDDNEIHLFQIVALQAVNREIMAALFIRHVLFLVPIYQVIFKARN